MLCVISGVPFLVGIMCKKKPIPLLLISSILHSLMCLGYSSVPLSSFDIQQNKNI